MLLGLIFTQSGNLGITTRSHIRCCSLARLFLTDWHPSVRRIPNKTPYVQTYEPANMPSRMSNTRTYKHGTSYAELTKTSPIVFLYLPQTPYFMSHWKTASHCPRYKNTGSYSWDNETQFFNVTKSTVSETDIRILGQVHGTMGHTFSMWHEVWGPRQI